MHVHNELNFDAEIKKLQLKESRLQGPYLKLKEQMSSASYAQKVPLAIQSRDTERLRQLEKELNDTRQSIEQLVQRKEASAM
jgi:valyl-tRNA synthetase